MKLLNVGSDEDMGNEAALTLAQQVGGTRRQRFGLAAQVASRRSFATASCCPF
jgi:hypothetical protein